MSIIGSSSRVMFSIVIGFFCSSNYFKPLQLFILSPFSKFARLPKMLTLDEVSIKDCTLGYSKHLLEIQYRRHPCISKFPHANFFYNRISYGPAVKQEGYVRSYLPGPIYGAYLFIHIENDLQPPRPFIWIWDSKCSNKIKVFTWSLHGQTTC
jgi:superfamily I DNA and/or RNA helicase